MAIKNYYFSAKKVESGKSLSASSGGVGGGGTALENNYVSNAIFDTNTGILTLKRQGLTDISTPLDGRYLTQENDTLDTVVDRGNSTSRSIITGGLLSTGSLDNYGAMTIGGDATFNGVNTRVNGFFEVERDSNLFRVVGTGGLMAIGTTTNTPLILSSYTFSTILLNPDGTASFLDGSESNPSLKIGDGGGIYRVGSNVLGVSTNGTNRLTINSSGLTVNGNVYANGGNSIEWNEAYSKRINSVTNTGNSGSATLISNVLNIPSYTLSGLGGEPEIQSGTTSQYWRGDKTWRSLDSDVYSLGFLKSGDLNDYALQSWVTSNFVSLSGSYSNPSWVTSLAASKITGLSLVATTGSYNDLSDKPIIPTDNSQLTNGAGYITNADLGNVAYKDQPNVFTENQSILGSLTLVDSGGAAHITLKDNNSLSTSASGYILMTDSADANTGLVGMVGDILRLATYSGTSAISFRTNNVEKLRLNQTQLVSSVDTIINGTLTVGNSTSDNPFKIVSTDSLVVLQMEDSNDIKSIIYTGSTNTFSFSNGSNFLVNGNTTVNGTITTNNHGTSANWKAAYDWVNANSTNIAYKNLSNVFTEGQVIRESSSGNIGVSSAFTPLILDSNEVSSYIQFLGNTTQIQGFLFGDNDANVGAITYNHSTNSLSFRTNDITDRLIIDSSGNSTFSGIISATGGNSTQWNTAYDWVNTNSANVALRNSNNNFSVAQVIEASGFNNAALIIKRTDTSSDWGISGYNAGAFQIYDRGNGSLTRLLIDSSGDTTLFGGLLVNGTLTSLNHGTSSNWKTAYDRSISSLSFNTSNGVLTYNGQDGGAFSVDLDGRYLTSSENYYLNSASFNTGNGLLTLGRSGLSAITVDLDGRYVTQSSSATRPETRYANFTQVATENIRAQFVVDADDWYEVSGMLWVQTNSGGYLRFVLGQTSTANFALSKIPEETIIRYNDNPLNPTYEAIPFSFKAKLDAGTNYMSVLNSLNTANGDLEATVPFPDNGGVELNASYVKVQRVVSNIPLPS